jgi:hypothetical protein
MSGSKGSVSTFFSEAVSGKLKMKSAVSGAALAQRALESLREKMHFCFEVSGAAETQPF